RARARRDAALLRAARAPARAEAATVRLPVLGSVSTGAGPRHREDPRPGAAHRHAGGHADLPDGAGADMQPAGPRPRVPADRGDRGTGMTIEVLYFSGCPHAAGALALVRTCVARLGLAVEVLAREGAYPSPSVRVDGRDIMGEPGTAQPACRLDVPTEDRVMAALRAAGGGRAP